MGGNSGRGEQVRVSDGRTHDGSGRGDGRGRARARGRDDAPRTRAEGGAGLREEHVDALAPGERGHGVVRGGRRASASSTARGEHGRRARASGVETSGELESVRWSRRARGDAGLVVLGGAEEGPGEDRAHSQPRGLECPRRRVVHEPRGKTDARARRGRPTRVSTRSSSLTRIFVGAARRAREIGRSRDFLVLRTPSRARLESTARASSHARASSRRAVALVADRPPRAVSANNDVLGRRALASLSEGHGPRDRAPRRRVRRGRRVGGVRRAPRDVRRGGVAALRRRRLLPLAPLHPQARQRHQDPRRQEDEILPTRHPPDLRPPAPPTSPAPGGPTLARVARESQPAR